MDQYPVVVLTRDIVVQKKPGVDYRRYSFGETSGKVFCLLEAPRKEAVIVVYREAHGLAADEIVEVKLSS